MQISLSLRRLNDAMVFGERGVEDPLRRRRLMLIANVAFVVALLGMLFQVGHFAEHVFQFIVWVLGDLSNICGRDTPWMSSWVSAMVSQLGTSFVPMADARRQMMIGMETLHLIGNFIFLVGLVALHYCARSRWSRWAVYIETFHLYEHVMLTVSAYFIGKPIGMSTLFGGANSLLDKDLAVGVRVSWHFLMNLLPLPFAMMAVVERIRDFQRTSALPRG